MNLSPSEPLLTLEPLIEAVRQGVAGVGWELSGLQKTTSHQFEGRWAGDSTRSAYLFFHHPSAPDWASIDVFLDETSQGLMGNVALVVDACRLEQMDDVEACLAALGGLAAAAVPEGLRAPVTLRFRLDDGRQAPGRAEAEVRFKLRFPKAAMAAGAPVVTALSAATVKAFHGLLSEPALAVFLVRD